MFFKACHKNSNLLPAVTGCGTYRRYIRDTLPEVPEVFLALSVLRTQDGSTAGLPFFKHGVHSPNYLVVKQYPRSSPAGAYYNAFGCIHISKASPEHQNHLTLPLLRLRLAGLRAGTHHKHSRGGRFFLTTRGWTPLDCLEDRAMTIARRFRGFGGFARRLYSWGLSRTISISLYTLFGITEIIIHVQPSHDTRHRDLLILNPYLNANIGRSSTVQIRSKVSGTKPPKLYR